MPLICIQNLTLSLKHEVSPCAPVLSVLPLALFAAPGHLGLVARFSGRSNLDRCVLQSCGLQGHPVATLLKKKEKEE